MDAARKARPITILGLIMVLGSGDSHALEASDDKVHFAASGQIALVGFCADKWHAMMTQGLASR